MKQFTLKIGHRWLILVCGAFFPLMLVTLISILLLSQVEVQLFHEGESVRIVSLINNIGREVYDGAQNLISYAFVETKPAKEGYVNDTVEISDELKQLEELVWDSPKQLENVRDLERVANDGLRTLDRFCTVIEQPEKGLFIAQGASLRRDLTAKLSQLSLVSKRIVDEQDKSQKEAMLDSARTRNLVINILYSSIAVNFGFAIALALFFSKGITKRLAILVDNAERLPRRKTLNDPLEGGDEIAYLDDSFHRMADQMAEMTRKERAIVDNAVEVICTINAAGRFTAVNPAALTVWGHKPGDLFGKKVIDIVVEEDRPKISHAFEEMIGGKSLKEFEARIKKKDGTVSDTLWSATWSAQEEALFCVAHDITERKELERLKQDFVAMVSHDLRTPLTSIQFAINIALEGIKDTAPPDALEELKTAERIGDSLISMINALLDLEKIEAGRLQLNLSEMKASHLIKRACDQVVAIAHANEIKIEVPTEDMRLVADVDRLLQVLVNLLSNAVKFSPNGSTIKVTLGTVDDCVEMRVSDQGKGIPAAYRDAVFDRFQQIKMSQFRFKGTGLGLAIAKAIVEAHGGKIGVDSEDGQGCTFWFRIPLTPTIAADSAPLTVQNPGSLTGG